MKSFLNKKIAKIENSKNTVCEISKSACRKLRFYKWLRKLISKKSTHEKMLNRSVK